MNDGFTMRCPTCGGEDQIPPGRGGVMSRPRTTSRTVKAKLPPDPDGINDIRARWAAEALWHIECMSGVDHEDAPVDLIADLMHWCDRNGFDFDAQLARAAMRYQAETDGA
jgi:hypothetical protein